MKLIEKEIEFQRKEKIELNKLIEQIEVNIQNNFNDINNNKLAIETLKTSILDEKQQVLLITNKYEDNLLNSLIKVFTLGFINSEKIKKIKISQINKKIDSIEKNITSIETNILEIILVMNQKKLEKSNILKQIDILINKIKELENQFIIKLYKFRDELVSFQNKIISYSNCKYINQYIKIDFENQLEIILHERKIYFNHERIKNDIIELISFKKNIDKWVENSNLLFIKNEKILEKDFFDTIESKPLTDKQKDAVLTNEVNNLVLAGAGSGKTSVVVAKVCYLDNKNIVNLDEILILAFNKKAQEELEERFNAKNKSVEVRTFHSFGLSIIGRVTNEKPDICKMSESSNNMNIFLENTIRELIKKDDIFQTKFLEFNAYFKIPYVDENDFNNLGEYYDYQNNYDMKTLKQQLIDKTKRDSDGRITFNRETVKSYQELMIANFFTLNCIDYMYEASYKYNTATANKRQYKPDFYLPEYDIYIEHFGIDREGKTAPYVKNKEYLDGIEWKVNLHKQNDTKLIQTFSYEFNENHLLDSLKEKLLSHGVKLRDLPKDEIINLLNASIEDKTFTKLFSTFMNHFKSNRHNIKSLLIENKEVKRTYLFLEIFEFIYNKYIEFQQNNNCIDFDDMIVKALEFVEDGSYKHHYKHIFIDEFQDISTTRSNLIKELLSQNKCSLTVVGDDWQSINRFAGSNIEIIQKFEEIFGYSKTVALDYSFRFDDQVSQVASNFIQKNPYQLIKEIKTIKQQQHNKFSICVYWNSSDGNKIEQTINDLTSILNLIVKKEGNLLKTVKILDRYNFNLKGIENINNSYSTLDINFTSVHSSKGLEADYIIVLNVISGKYGFPSKIEDDPILNVVTPASDDFADAEERRLFYVALTRTKGTIFLLSDIYHKSIFLEEIIEDNEDKIYFLNDPKIKLINCPECKIGLLKKRSTSTIDKKDRFFYGCSNFPRCEYTERVHYCPECQTEMYKDLDKKISICKNDDCNFESELCEVCNDYMVERNGQYGRFLGCLGYPKCNHSKKILK